MKVIVKSSDAEEIEAICFDKIHSQFPFLIKRKNDAKKKSFFDFILKETTEEYVINACKHCIDVLVGSGVDSDCSMDCFPNIWTNLDLQHKIDFILTKESQLNLVKFIPFLLKTDMELIVKHKPEWHDDILNCFAKLEDNENKIELYLECFLSGLQHDREFHHKLLGYLVSWINQEDYKSLPAPHRLDVIHYFADSDQSIYDSFSDIIPPCSLNLKEITILWKRIFGDSTKFVSFEQIYCIRKTMERLTDVVRIPESFNRMTGCGSLEKIITIRELWIIAYCGYYSEDDQWKNWAFTRLEQMLVDQKHFTVYNNPRILYLLDNIQYDYPQLHRRVVETLCSDSLYGWILQDISHSSLLIGHLTPGDAQYIIKNTPCYLNPVIQHLCNQLIIGTTTNTTNY